MLYVSLYTFFLISTYLSILNRFIINRKVLFFLIFILFILSSMRFATGTDFYSYFYLFKASTPITEGVDYYTYYEVGFRVITSIVKFFTDSSIIYFTLLSFIPLYFLYLSIRKYYINYYMASFMYLCVFYLAYVYNGIGQSIIMSIFLYLLEDIFKYRTLKIVIIATLAIFIHKSALMIFVAYGIFILFKKIKIDYIFYMGMLVSFIIYKLKIATILFSIIFSDALINVYLENFIEPTSLFQIVTRTSIVIILFYFYKKMPNNAFYRNVFLIYLGGFFLYISFSEFNMLATRINMFFRITEILLFSNAILYAKNLFTKHIVFAIIVVIYSFSYFKVISMPSFEYHFFWEM